MSTPHHLEISRRLALAIGWPEDQITPLHQVLRDGTLHLICWNAGGRPFWYHDHKVIWPIAARYNAFPVKWRSEWRAVALTDTGSKTVREHTPELAVAMAVIQHAGK